MTSLLVHYVVEYLRITSQYKKSKMEIDTFLNPRIVSLFSRKWQIYMIMNLGSLVPVNNMFTILICVTNSLHSTFDIENEPLLTKC